MNKVLSDERSGAKLRVTENLSRVTREFYSIRLICRNLYAIFSHVKKAYRANQNGVQLFFSCGRITNQRFKGLCEPIRIVHRLHSNNFSDLVAFFSGGASRFFLRMALVPHSFGLPHKQLVNITPVYIYLLKTELGILDFQHFHWLAGHRLSAHIPALPNMVNESIKESWIKIFPRNWRSLKIV